jgi:ABC-type transport system involved in cytochrome c biogenesis ATPase subunit
MHTRESGPAWGLPEGVTSLHAAHPQAKLAEVIAALEAKTGMVSYAEHTPEGIKAADAEKLGRLQAEAAQLAAHLATMRAML